MLDVSVVSFVDHVQPVLSSESVIRCMITCHVLRCLATSYTRLTLEPTRQQERLACTDHKHSQLGYGMDICRAYRARGDIDMGVPFLRYV